MHNSNSRMIPVNGAKLYCLVRGSGPIILLIAGGSGDADSFDALRPWLEQDYTVVSYDRRGYTRSPIDPGILEGTVAISTQAADAAAILATMSAGPVRIFGSSLGALIGLELLERHASLVHHLVAHEPPLVQLLPAGSDTGPDIRPGEKPDEVLNRFAASLGLKRGVAGGPDNPRRAENSRFFLEHEAAGVGECLISMTSLAKLRAQLTFAGGAEGASFFPYQCARIAADETHAPFAIFPGKHNGFATHPEDFARLLLRLFSGS